MAAFTRFEKASLERYLRMFELGELKSFEAILSGIENSNYFIELDKGGCADSFVLTISEQFSFDDAPFFNELMNLLFKKGLPVPQPQRTLDGMSSTIFCGKPSWLFTRLEGDHPETITSSHCQTIGQHLADLHLAAKGAKYSRPSPYNAKWVDETLSNIEAQLSEADQHLLRTVATDYISFDIQAELPQGIIHGDLFTDNTLFVGQNLTGIIDFYHACNDFLLQDIAITINDWCKTANGEIDNELKAALLAGYESIRPLSSVESEQLIKFQQFAALRFILTRFISGGDQPPLKDPYQLLRLLRFLKR